MILTIYKAVQIWIEKKNSQQSQQSSQSKRPYYAIMYRPTFVERIIPQNIIKCSESSDPNCLNRRCPPSIASASVVSVSCSSLSATVEWSRDHESRRPRPPPPLPPLRRRRPRGPRRRFPTAADRCVEAWDRWRSGDIATLFGCCWTGWTAISSESDWNCWRSSCPSPVDRRPTKRHRDHFITPRSCHVTYYWQPTELQVTDVNLFLAQRRSQE